MVIIILGVFMIMNSLDMHEYEVVPILPFFFYYLDHIVSFLILLHKGAQDYLSTTPDAEKLKYILCLYLTLNLALPFLLLHYLKERLKLSTLT